MTAGKWNFIVENSTTFERILTWRDANGTPINLTGYSVQMQARKTKTASAVLFDFSPFIALGTTNGQITILLEDEDTAGLNWPGAARHSLVLEDGDGNKTRLLEGTCSISYEPTRDEES